MIRICIILLMGVAFAGALAAQSRPPAPTKPVDGVRILEVLPSKLVVGEEQEVFVRVRYDLESLEEAQLNLGFNTTGSARFRVFAKELVKKGEGEIVLSARVTPRDWGELVFFQAFVSLGEPNQPPPRPAPGEKPAPRSGRPGLAVDHVPIPLASKK